MDHLVWPKGQNNICLFFFLFNLCLLKATLCAAAIDYVRVVVYCALHGNACEFPRLWIPCADAGRSSMVHLPGVEKVVLGSNNPSATLFIVFCLNRFFFKSFWLKFLFKLKILILSFQLRILCRFWYIIMVCRKCTENCVEFFWSYPWKTVSKMRRNKSVANFVVFFCFLFFCFLKNFL